jgi:hypothetical protein
VARVSTLARLRIPHSVEYGYLCFAGPFYIHLHCLYRPSDSGVTILLNLVAQQLSMCEACAVSKVPMTISFVLNKPSVSRQEVLTVVEATFNRWCPQSVSYAL